MPKVERLPFQRVTMMTERVFTDNSCLILPLGALKMAERPAPPTLRMTRQRHGNAS